MTFPSCKGIKFFFHVFSKFVNELDCRVKLLKIFPFNVWTFRSIGDLMIVNSVFYKRETTIP